MSTRLTSEDAPVLLDDHTTHLEITLNRPDTLNALTQEVVDALGDAYQRFEDGPWHVAVVTGAGRAFCAGANFNEPPTNDDRAYPNFGVPLSKPVIVAVEGYAIGGGFVLTQAADIVVAGRGAKFGYPEARIGVTGGGATLIATRVPTKVVADLLLTARSYDADRALAAGLVSEVTEQGGALAAARELAGLVAANSLACVRALKGLIDADTQRSTVEAAQRVGALTAGTRDRSVLAKLREAKGH